MDELKACPFCGKPIVKRIGLGGITYFECKNAECRAIVSFGGSKKLTPMTYEAENPVANFNRRAAPENKVLTCAGCVHHNPDAPWSEICFDCKRQTRQDMYLHQPEQEGTT